MANVDVRPAYRKLYLCLYVPESRRRLVHCLDQRDYFMRYVRVSFNHITRKWRTNTAARTTPIKSAPNVFPRSKCGSVEEEDIDDALSNSVSNAVVPPYYIFHIPWGNQHIFVWYKLYRCNGQKSQTWKTNHIGHPYYDAFHWCITHCWTSFQIQRSVIIGAKPAAQSLKQVFGVTVIKENRLQCGITVKCPNTDMPIWETNLPHPHAYKSQATLPWCLKCEPPEISSEGIREKYHGRQIPIVALPSHEYKMPVARYTWFITDLLWLCRWIRCLQDRGNRVE